MPKFEIESTLAVEAVHLATDLFCIKGVNYELLPLARMTAPKEWEEKALADWPLDEILFNSYIFLFGIIPIDIHRFRLTGVSKLGFQESSVSLINSKWNHSRYIIAVGESSKVRDVVEFESRVRLIGTLLKLVYEYIFAHRHRRLQVKYKG